MALAEKKASLHPTRKSERVRQGVPGRTKGPKVSAGAGPYLQCDFIFHEQSNFDIHEIEVIL